VTPFECQAKPWAGPQATAVATGICARMAADSPDKYLSQHVQGQKTGGEKFPRLSSQRTAWATVVAPLSPRAAKVPPFPCRGMERGEEGLIQNSSTIYAPQSHGNRQEVRPGRTMQVPKAATAGAQMLALNILTASGMAHPLWNMVPTALWQRSGAIFCRQPCKNRRGRHTAR